MIHRTLYNPTCGFISIMNNGGGDPIELDWKETIEDTFIGDDRGLLMFCENDASGCDYQLSVLVSPPRFNGLFMVRVRESVWADVDIKTHDTYRDFRCSDILSVDYRNPNYVELSAWRRS